MKIKTPSIFNSSPSKAVWEGSRRDEILQLFSTQVYGITPAPNEYSVSFFCESFDEITEGGMTVTAVRKDYSVCIKARYGEHRFPFSLHIPSGVEKPPVILFLSIWDKVEVCPTSEKSSKKIPVSFLLSKGYAVAILTVTDVDTDCNDGFINGIESIFTPPEKRLETTFATIGAWAFGACRVLDCLLQEAAVDGKKTIIVGHSRGGKTALWAAAQDTRFFGVVSNNSGCTGAALSTSKVGEHIADINENFPYWFCENYKKYSGNEQALQIDQHMLLSLIAPRFLYVASADKDLWADPDSEYQSLQLAKGAYELYGSDAVGKTAYHLRQGEHNITPYDWGKFLAFFG